MKFEQPKPPSEHWYDSDSNPRHDCTLRDARKLGLYPSVTSILNTMASPQLESWKINQAIMAALTLPRMPGEDDQQFMARVLDDSKQHTKKAADIGNQLHDYAENFYKKIPVKDVAGYELDCSYLREWIGNNLGEGIAEDQFTNNEYGFAGKQDWAGLLKNGKYGHVDYKSQNVKPGNKPVYYSKWCQQLAAYGKGDPDAVYISVVIGSNKDNQFIQSYEWTHDEIQTGWKIFKHLLAIWMLDRNYDPRSFQSNS